MALSCNSLAKRRKSLMKFSHLEVNLTNFNSQNKNINQFGLPAEFIKIYEVIELIGKGYQAQVFKVKHIQSQAIFAAKAYIFNDEEEILSIKREVKILSSLSHPSIISFHSFLSYPSDQTYILLTEYFAGTPLSSIISSLPSSFLPAFFHTVTRLLLSVLAYLKKMKVVHWDLNCSNILYDKKENSIRVVDFGVAHIIENDDYFWSLEGNPKFRPPLNKRDFNAFEVDLWGVWLVGIGILNGRVVSTKEVEENFGRGMNFEFFR